jgi:ribosomal protein L39E
MVRTQYGLYQDAVSLCKVPEQEKWKKAVYLVFDAPTIANKPYEERIQYLKDLKQNQSLPSFVNIINVVKCEGNKKDYEFISQHN